MQCNQLIRLVKEWHTHIIRETMAPARMMQFVDNHVKDCGICRADSGLAAEIEQIRERVMPDNKLPRQLRSLADDDDTLTPDIFSQGDEADGGGTPDDSDADGLF